MNKKFEGLSCASESNRRTMQKKLFKAVLYLLTAIIGSVSLLLISAGIWLLWAVALGYSVVVILPILVCFGSGAYLAKEACCRKWSLQPRFVLLAAFMPMFVFAAFYLAKVLYRIFMKKYNGFLSELSAALDLSFFICFFGTVVLIFLSCIVFGRLAKKNNASIDRS